MSFRVAAKITGTILLGVVAFVSQNSPDDVSSRLCSWIADQHMRAECQDWLGPNINLRSLQVAFVVLLIAIWGGTIVQLIAKRIKAANAKLGLRVAEQIAYGL